MNVPKQKQGAAKTRGIEQIIKQIVKLYLPCSRTAAEAGTLPLPQQQQRSVSEAEARGHAAQACWEHQVLTWVYVCPRTLQRCLQQYCTHAVNILIRESIC